MDDIESRVKSALIDPDQDKLSRVSRTCHLSDFFLDILQFQPFVIEDLIQSGDLDRSYDAEYWARKFVNLRQEDLDRQLRSIRKRELARIVYRDLNRMAELVETTSDLSSLADLCVQHALDLYYQAQCHELGVPKGSQTGKDQQMVVLGLGKLGARELNLSSDIDLIFLYDESGWLEDNENSLSNQEFFIRLSRRIIHCLSNKESDGFVFRVDMRLRPYGDSGALILNRNAMEQYYLQQGRDWERYAYIKARSIAGDKALGNDFLQWLKPFVYRKHIDYGAIESLRQMKEMINTEVQKKNMRDDLKLGPGGIREIEFIVQANQLIWGGKDPLLQEARLLDTLNHLSERNHLPESDANVLESAYIFLRNSEHVVQAERDRQTHRLPESELSRSRLATAMGFETWESYLCTLDAHRNQVKDCFSRIVSSGEAERDDLLEGNLHWQAIWRESDESLANLLKGTPFKDYGSFKSNIVSLKKEIQKGDASEKGKERLDKLLPILLGTIAEQQHPDVVLQRVMPVIIAISRRSTYVSFLLENLDALKRMTFLCGMSRWLADQLHDFPVLLYELTDKQIHEARFEKAILVRELDQLTEPLDESDLEAQMDAMRQFKNSWVLKIAIYELLDSLPIMKASDALTEVAEIILNKTTDIAWSYLVARHGLPVSTDHSDSKKFGIVAYGKLGGFELGYGSDLDLIFIHDWDIHAETGGNKPVSINTFFVRLAQRIVHILSSYTQFGVLYKIDLRLRPNGNKGPLVATMNAFKRYQRQDAWTWEHQALVRARFVAGDAFIEKQFQSIRSEILTRKRNIDTLLQEVVSMREKMRTHLSTDEKSPFNLEEEGADILVSGFDLKHGIGAIVDIEFMVQYAVLAGSSEHPELAVWTDKIRILDELSKLGLFSALETSVLQEAYLAYRAAVHYQSLGGQMETFDSLETLRRDVARIWGKHMLK